MLALLVPLRLGFVPPWLAAMFRIEYAVRPWVMLDVFMLGALVSLVKLTQIATVYPGTGLYALGAVHRCCAPRRCRPTSRTRCGAASTELRPRDERATAGGEARA